MKFRCESGALKDAIATVAKAAETRSNFPVLAGVRLEVKDAVLTATCTNIDLTMRRQVNCAGLEEGFAVLPAAPLVGLLKAADQPIFELEVGMGENEASVKVGAAAATIPLLTAAEWPRLAAPSLDTAWRSTGGRVPPIAGWTTNEKTNPALAAVLLEQQPDGTLRLVATDKFRMMVVELPGTIPGELGLETSELANGNKFDHWPRLLLPQLAMAPVLDRIGKAGTAVAWRDGRLRMEADDLSLVVTGVAAVFPPYEALYARLPEPTCRVKVGVPAFRAALARAAVFEDDDGVSRVEVNWAPEGVVLTTVSKRWGTITEPLDEEAALAEGTAVVATYNARLLDEALHCHDQEQLTVDLLPRPRPLLIRSESLLTVLMPYVV